MIGRRMDTMASCSTKGVSVLVTEIGTDSRFVGVVVKEKEGVLIYG